MSINIFKLEEYLAKYEFSAPYLLCCSDAESFSMHEVIEMAASDEKKLWNNLRLGYTEIQGLPILRTKIAENLYPTLDASNVLCFAGVEEGIFCALYTLCEPGDHIIALIPCYQSLTEIPKLKGATVTTIALQEEKDWRIDIAAIKYAIKSNTKCIIINFPHNPTGQIITQTELNNLVELCKAHDLYLFSDEVYRLLGKPSKDWTIPAAEVYSKALSVSGMSKVFGMAGLRVGWIVCHDKELLRKIESIKHYTSICNSAPAEILSLIVLNNKDKILFRNNQIIAKNLQLLDEFINEYRHLFEWVRPQGGCIGFIKYKKPEPVSNFVDRLVKEKGVLLMPASVYDYQGNYFRIGFGRKNMKESLSQFEEFLKKYENI